MRRRSPDRFLRSAALALLLGGLVPVVGLGQVREAFEAAGASEPRVPHVELEAPPRYGGEAALLRWLPSDRLEAVMDLVGLQDGGPPIRVVLAPEDHLLARGVPQRISGYAVPEHDLAVLLPERVHRYPYDSMEVLFLHEVTHLLVARAAGGREVPRWFNEGVALLASRGWSLEDRSRVVLGGVSGIPADTGELEAAFAGESYEIQTAYALAGALLHHLVQHHGRQVVRGTLAGLAAGDTFEDSFAAAAGVPLAQAETAFWKRYRLWYRWLPFLTSGAALWMAISALAILAGARRRRRDAEIRRRWDAEEGPRQVEEMDFADEPEEARETVH